MSEPQESCPHARWKVQVEGKLWRCKSCGILTAPEARECSDPWCADLKFGSHPQHWGDMSVEEATTYVAERDRVRTAMKELRIVTPQEASRWLVANDWIPVAAIGDLAHTVATEPDRTAAAEKRARTYERLVEINGNTAERMEAERDEACEAILRVEAFCEQMETEKFWLEYGGPAVAAVAARIRAELKVRP